MKEVRFEIIGHDGEVDQKTLDAMSHNLRELLNQGFHHDTSITIGSCSFGVFSKDVEIAMSTAPATEPAKRPPLSEWPRYVLETNRHRLIEQQYTIGRVWTIAGYVMDWHGCDGDKRIAESIPELFELVSAVQDVLTNAGIAISVHGQGLNRHVTRRAFVEQIAEIICEQAKGIGQDAATTVQEASDLTPIDPNMISGINKAYAQIERQRKDIYRLTMDKTDLENRLRQIHGAANYKGNSHAAFRTYAIEVAAAGLARLRPQEESKSALDHQPDNTQLAELPTMEQVQLDYEELKSLREANKRQGAIIDDLLRDKAELKAKADSLAESVMSITDMNSEIAAKREDAARVAFSLGVTYTSNGGTIDSDQIRKSFDQWWSTFETGEGMMTVLDAKTLAHAAYNRGHSIGNGTMDVIQITGNADFENWWIEFRKENGFGSEKDEAAHVFPPSDFPAFTAGYFFNQLKEPLRTHVMSQANNMLSEAESLHYALDSRQFLDWDKTREGRAFWEDVTAYLKSGNVPIESAGSRLARQCMPDNYVFPAAKP